MKAIRLKNYGDVDQFQIEEIPTPQPGPDEVLVKIEASAVNHIDLMVRQGFMAQMMPLELPAILGGDAAGTVVAVGPNVTTVKTGDRVVAHIKVTGKGAHAELAVVKLAGIAKLPDNLGFEQGAALPYAGLTGRQIVAVLGVKRGDRVLVSGAMGNVGRAAVQYLKDLGAIPVAGVLPAQLEEAKRLVGDAIDITAVPSAATFNYAVSAAMPAAAQVVAHVVDGGKIGSAVFTPKGVNEDNRVKIEVVSHQQDPAMLQTIVDAASSGDLVIPVAKTFPLAQLGAAHAAMAAGVDGKIVIQH